MEDQGRECRQQFQESLSKGRGKIINDTWQCKKVADAALFLFGLSLVYNFYYTAVSACHRDFCELLFKFFIYLFFALFHFNSWQIVQAGMRSGFLSVSRVKLKFATLQDEIWLVKHVCFFWTALLVIAVYIRLSWTSASLRIITWLTGHMWAKDRRMVHCYEKQNDLKWIV